MVANMTTFVILRHPVTIFVTDLTNPDNLTDYILILDSLIIFLSLCLDLSRSNHEGYMRE